MSVLSVFVTIFSGIAVIGVIISIVALINRRRSRIKEHVSDDEAQVDIGEQYRRMYNDRHGSNLK